MSDYSLLLCDKDKKHCFEIASATSGPRDPPTHMFAVAELIANLDIGPILTAPNPTAAARITGLIFVAQELRKLAASLQRGSPDQAKTVTAALANTIKQIGLVAQYKG